MIEISSSHANCPYQIVNSFIRINELTCVIYPQSMGELSVEMDEAVEFEFGNF